MSVAGGEIEISELSGATSVAIVVHGIGDHTSSDILGSARQGYRAIKTEESRIEDVSFQGFPQPDGKDGPQQALKIVANGKIHFVMPIVWCDLRTRATHAFRGSLSGFGNVIQAIGLALGPIFISWFDIARCVLKTKPPVWRFAIVVLDLVMIGLTIAFWIGATLLVSMIGWYMYDHTGLRDIHWYHSVLLVLSLVMVRYALKRLVQLFDFVGDVATYVARQGSRFENEAALARIVENVSRQAPNARILLVGHSLGSVFVTHALHKASIWPSASRRLILITLGSPLKLMSQIFPGSIRSPDEIASNCEGNANILFWANLWRDCDFIGRDLSPTHHAVFAETSLGNGPHWDMWSDERLWLAVVMLLQVEDRTAFDSIKSSWDMESIIAWPEDRAEVYGAAFSLWVRRLFVAPMIFIGAILFAYWGSGGRWFESCRSDALPAIWIVWVFIEILAIALFYASIMPDDPLQHRDKTGTQFSRRFLGALRRSKAVSDSVFHMLVFIMLAIPAILSWALAR